MNDHARGRKVHRVTAAVLERDGRILIARRGKGDPLEGKWEFPGGKMEPGESPEACLRRELREELGIETRIGPYLGTSHFAYVHASIELVAYRATFVSGELELREHQEVAWIPSEELLAYDLAEADIPIARMLARGKAT